jgi:hypothetical protein
MAGENRPGEMIRDPHLSRRDHDQQLGVLQRIAFRPEGVTNSRDFRKSRQSGNRSSFFHIRDSAD